MFLGIGFSRIWFLFVIILFCQPRQTLKYRRLIGKRRVLQRLTLLDRSGGVLPVSLHVIVFEISSLKVESLISSPSCDLILWIRHLKLSALVMIHRVFSSYSGLL